MLNLQKLSSMSLTALGIAAGVGSLLGGVGSSYANYKATENTNKTNYKIAQLNNDYNLRMQREMNDYNSPLNQRQLYEAAGFSPWSAVENASFNSSQTQAPRAESVTMQAPQFDQFDIGGAVTNAINTYANFEKTSAEAQRQKIENQFTAERAILELGKIRAETKSYEQKAQIDRWIEEYQRIEAENRKRALDDEHNMSVIQSRGYQMDNLRKNVELAYLPEQLQQQIVSLKEDIASKRVTRNHEITKMIKTMLEANGIKFTNDLNKEIRQFLVDKSRRDAYGDFTQFLTSEFGNDIKYGIGSVRDFFHKLPKSFGKYVNFNRRVYSSKFNPFNW